MLPESGAIAVFLPVAGTDLSVLPKARVVVIQPVFPDHDAFRAAGYTCRVRAGDTRFAAALVCLPRAKARARAVIAQAMELTDGPVIIDGAKTDGIDGILKDMRKRGPISAPLSKAHGKLFWTAAAPAAFADWHEAPPHPVQGFITAPGVFSADGIDPASRLLAEALPAAPGRHLADLGAGWGYLAARLLERDGIERLDLVEADHIALDCARQNVTDPRAQFHWADATRWAPDRKYDAVVMNPPFHTGRRADQGLGRAFIQAAARLLTPSGQLWMVANRHLGYEAVLKDCFALVQEIAGDTRFKVIHATRPARGAPQRARD